MLTIVDNNSMKRIRPQISCTSRIDSFTVGSALSRSTLSSTIPIMHTITPMIFRLHSWFAIFTKTLAKWSVIPLIQRRSCLLVLFKYVILSSQCQSLAGLARMCISFLICEEEICWLYKLSSTIDYWDRQSCAKDHFVGLVHWCVFRISRAAQRYWLTQNDDHSRPRFAPILYQRDRLPTYIGTCIVCLKREGIGRLHSHGWLNPLTLPWSQTVTAIGRRRWRQADRDRVK